MGHHPLAVFILCPFFYVFVLSYHLDSIFTKQGAIPQPQDCNLNQNRHFKQITDEVLISGLIYPHYNI